MPDMVPGFDPAVLKKLQDAMRAAPRSDANDPLGQGLQQDPFGGMNFNPNAAPAQSGEAPAAPAGGRFSGSIAGALAGMTGDADPNMAATQSGIPTDWARQPAGTIFKPDQYRQLQPIDASADSDFLSGATMPGSVSTFKAAGPMLQPGVPVPAVGGSAWDSKAKDAPGTHTMYLQNGSQPGSKVTYGQQPDGGYSARSIQIGGPQGPQALFQPGGTQSEFEDANKALEGVYNRASQSTPGVMSGPGAAGAPPAGGPLPGGMSPEQFARGIMGTTANRWMPVNGDTFAQAQGMYNNQQGMLAEQARAKGAMDAGTAALMNATTAAGVAGQGDPHAAMRREVIKSELNNPAGYDPARLQLKLAQLDAIANAPGVGPRQPGSSGAAGPMSAALGGAGPDAMSNQGDLLKMYGPDLYSSINSRTPGEGGTLGAPRTPISQALTKIFQRDQAQPGWFQQNRAAILGNLKGLYGDEALRDASDQTGMGLQLRGIMNRVMGRNPSDTENATNAFARELGLPFRGDAAPIEGGSNLNPNFAGTARRAAQIAAVGVPAAGLARLAGAANLPLSVAGARTALGSMPLAGRVFGGAGASGAGASGASAAGALTPEALAAALGGDASMIGSAGAGSGPFLSGMGGLGGAPAGSVMNGVNAALPAINNAGRFTPAELYQALLSMGGG